MARAALQFWCVAIASFFSYRQEYEYLKYYSLINKKLFVRQVLCTKTELGVGGILFLYFQSISRSVTEAVAQAQKHPRGVLSHYIYCTRNSPLMTLPLLEKSLGLLLHLSSKTAGNLPWLL